MQVITTKQELTRQVEACIRQQKTIGFVPTMGALHQGHASLVQRAVAENDVAIVPDVGMFASFDPVALDQACADACNRQNAMVGSMLDDKIKACGHGHDHFHTVSPNTNWKVQLEHAEKIGLGQREYELIEA